MALTNVYPWDHPHLTMTEIKNRGWSDSMVWSLLGVEDRVDPVNHFRNFTGARVWALDRVERAEATLEFEQAFLKSAKRRKLPDTWQATVLKRARAFRKAGRNLFPPLEASAKDRKVAEVCRDLKAMLPNGLRGPKGKPGMNDR